MADKHVIVAVHGIRDFGQWQDRLADLVSEREGVTASPYRYGYFSVVAFLIPFARWLVVRTFRRHLVELVEANPDARFSFVAHSFGTHIVANAIRGMKPSQVPHIDNIILAGSVLPSSFNWASVIKQSRVANKGIVRVINDCGWNDSVLILSQLLVLFTGMAGRVGFYGFIGNDVKNRFFPGGHGHYFQPANVDVDAFMREWWVPILTGREPPKDGLDFPPNSIPKGIFYALLRLCDPLKIAAYAALFFFVWNLGYLQPRRELAEESFRRQYETAAYRMQSERSVPDAFRSLLRLGGLQGSSNKSLRDTADLLARFAGQRLMTFETLRSGLRSNAIYQWGDASYLMSTNPVRLDVRRPTAAYHVPEYNAFILVGEKRSVSILDDRTGQVRWSTSIDQIGNDASHVKMWRLRGQSHIAVEFDVEQPEEDETPHYVVDVDLVRNTGTDFRGNLAAAEACVSIEREIELPDSDDDPTPEELQLTRERMHAQAARRAGCLLPLPVEVPPLLRFPGLSPEIANWSFTALPFHTGEQAPSEFCSYGQLHFPYIRHETSGDFRIKPIKPDDPTLEETWFGEGCFLEFEGPDSKRYVALNKVMGDAWAEWLICELRSTANLGRCIEGGYYYLAKGDLSMSPSKRYLVLLGDSSEEIGGASWSWIDLENMTLSSPERYPETHLSAAAMTDDTALILAPAAAPRGALELWAYKFVGAAAELSARQLIMPPEGFVVSEEESKSVHDSAKIIVRGGTYVVATAFQEIAAYSVAPDQGFYARMVSGIPWLQVPESEPLTVVWHRPGVDLPIGSNVGITYSHMQDILAISIGSSIRLVSTEDGTLLTPIANLSSNPVCRGPIQAVVLAEDLSVTATTDSCRAVRRPPLSVASVGALAKEPESFFGKRVGSAWLLPGETKAPPAEGN